MRNILSIMLFLTAAAMTPSRALADTCLGNCDSIGPNGVVGASPAGGNYQYVSTSREGTPPDLPPGLGRIAEVGAAEGATPVNGSEFLTTAFAALPGDTLEFYFNYVTSDGLEFDYSFVELLTAASEHVDWLVTVRSQPDIVSPILDALFPPAVSTLVPPAVTIVPGAPEWLPLEPFSEACFGVGCGFTGWVKSTYPIQAAGSYILRFGVTNWSDNSFDSGLAFDGITIASAPVDVIPEPGFTFLLTSALGAIVVYNRYRKGASRDSEASV